ncbi:MAG: glycosyltransferase [Ruminococcus sp.]|nr:glycosyltransferase [Ruminococcus sp.]
MKKDKRKKIAFNVSSINNWMGGVYYAHNMINLILHSEELRDEYEIHVLTSPANAPVFQKYGNRIKLVEINYGNSYLNSIYLVWYVHRHKIDYWYGLSLNLVERLIVKKVIMWIADFQYLHLPQYFSDFELKMRDGGAKYMAKQKNTLVLSSNDAKKDFLMQYKKHKCKCMVVHFTSNIEDEVLGITESEERETLTKYNLYQQKYIYIPNQFWQHKNHIVVLEMIEQYLSRKLENVIFVFTGQMNDYRNREYTEKLKKYFAREDISQVTENLGFLERKEQLVIMKNAAFLIQPSLFEGWGTVLEDAKVLDKRVILSDLPVHEEQKYEKCVLFKRTDAEDLLNKVELLLHEKSEDDLSKGLSRFHRDSQKYAEELARALK